MAKEKQFIKRCDVCQEPIDFRKKGWHRGRVAGIEYLACSDYHEVLAREGIKAQLGKFANK